MVWLSTYGTMKDFTPAKGHKLEIPLVHELVIVSFEAGHAFHQTGCDNSVLIDPILLSTLPILLGSAIH